MILPSITRTWGISRVTDASGVMYFSSEEITPALKGNLMVYDGVPEKNYRVAVQFPKATLVKELVNETARVLVMSGNR